MSRHLALLGGTTTWGDALAGLGRLARPGRLVEGPSMPGYEAAFARSVGVGDAISFAHGRIALYGILRALGVGPGDEVLVPSPTHVVVPNAVRYTGAVPVFVDCRPDSANMDLDDAERKVTPRTKALLAQHTFGTPLDLERAAQLAASHGIALIEDCVHALGSRYDGRPVGGFGVASFFSTEETKTISSTMGGMAATNDPELARALRRFQAECEPPSRWLVARYVLKLVAYQALTHPRVHRLTRRLYELGGRRNPLPYATVPEDRTGDRPADYEMRLGDAQAALALRQLGRLEDNLAHRRRIAEIYTERLGGPVAPDGTEPSLVRFPVWADDRERAVAAIRRVAVPGMWFTSVLEESDHPSVAGYADGTCPTAEAMAAHLVNLPTHPRVSERDAERIADAAAPLVRGLAA